MIGKRVELLRISCGLTQTELGKAVGVSQSKISRLERKPKEKVDLELVQRLAAFFKVPIQYFIPNDPHTAQITITLDMHNNVLPQTGLPVQNGGKRPRKRDDAAGTLSAPPSL